MLWPSLVFVHLCPFSVCLCVCLMSLCVSFSLPIADSWTKIVYHFQLRTQTAVSIDHIAASAAQPPVPFVDDVSVGESGPDTALPQPMS